ncbi:hypothetical protein A2U01_0057590, partial [Trifolium medium]|nr:hypothetical protein [Trifolium medium]
MAREPEAQPEALPRPKADREPEAPAHVGHEPKGQPQADPVHDGETPGEADFQEDEEGLHWALCIFEDKSLLNFSKGRRTRVFSCCTKAILRDMS